jgi:hypothetical protein
MIPQRPNEIDSTDKVREELIKLRDSYFKHWPEAIAATVLLSHAIALLAYLMKLEEAIESKEVS